MFFTVSAILLNCEACEKMGMNWTLLAGQATQPTQPESVGKVMADAGMTVLTGLVVVFSVLVLLTFIFWLFGKVMSGASGRKAPAAPTVKEQPAPRAVKPAAPVPAAPPSVEPGISEEVVAVIAAAVAAMSGDGKTYALRSVRVARGSRPVWAAAGLAENTRPF